MKRVVLCIALASLAVTCWGETMLSTELPSGLSAIGTSGAAMLQGTLTTDEEGVSTWFEWGPSAMTNRAEALEIGDWDGTSYLMATLPNLEAGKRYHYRLAANAGTNTYYSAEQSFSIPKVTLIGNNPMGLTLGSEYLEAGATSTEPPLQISAGQLHTLLLKADGTVKAWGGNSFGQTSIPPGTTNIVAIAAGFDHSVALRNDGTMLAWGNNYFEQTNVGGLPDLIAIAAGSGHTLALRSNGRPVGWGTYGYNLTTIPASATNVVAIAAGNGYDLALRDDGTIAAWGDLSYVTRAAAATNIVAISAAGNNCLGLKSDGTVISWGPSAVPADATNVVAIRAGQLNGSALRADGTLIIWGSGTNRTVAASATNVVDWALGSYHATVIRSDGSLVSWGDNSSGQTDCPADANLPSREVATAGNVNVNFPGNYVVTYQTSDINGTLAQATRTVAVYNAPNIPAPTVTVQNGGNTMSAEVSGSITPNGMSTTGWLKWAAVTGPGQGSQQTALGNGNRPVSVGADLNGLKSSQSYLCRTLASNSYETLQSVPTPIWAPSITVIGGANKTNTFGQTFTDPGTTVTGPPLAAGVSESYGVVLRADETIVTSSPEFRPVGASNVVAIAIGAMAGLGLHADGSVFAWGSNYYGQTNVPPNLKLTAIAVGYHHCLGVRSDGTVVAWGYSYYGEGGVPKGLRGVKAVAAGYDYSVALKHDGTLVAWGNNSAGQLTIPADATNITAIAAGYYHMIALRENGTVLAWGQNTYGQTNVPASATGVVAVAASQAHCLVLKSNGTLAAWGDSKLCSPLNGSFTTISAGYRHGIAVRTNGPCVVWSDLGQSIIMGSDTAYVALTATRSGDTVNPGTHTLTYSVTNSLGAVATATRTLTVLPPVTEMMPVQSISWTTNGIQLGLTNRAGRTLAVFTATNLMTPLAEWQGLGIMQENPSGYYQFTDSGATNHANRFYRFHEH